MQPTRLTFSAMSSVQRHGESSSPSRSPLTPSNANVLREDSCLASEPKRQRVNESKARDLFSREFDKENNPVGWICLKCKEEGKKRRVFKSSDASTGWLWKHLKSSHLPDYNHLKGITAADDAPMDRYVAGGVPHFTQDKFRREIVAWFVHDDIPFNEAQSEHLTRWVRTCNPKVTIPSRMTVVRDMEVLYDEFRVKMKEMLLTIGSKISITTDEWTSPNKLAFKAVTGHWLDDNWEPQQCLLGFEHIEGKHSAPNLHATFTKVLADWDMSVKNVFALTMDNASTNVAMVNLLGTQDAFNVDRSFRCFAHVLNLVCNQLMSDTSLTTIAEKIRAVARYVDSGGSAQRAEVWAKMCPRQLELDCKTRWSSTHDMLTNAVSMKSEIGDWMLTLPNADFNLLCITDEDWRGVDLLLSVLKPFAEATSCITLLKSNTTLGLVVPWYNWLYYDLQAKLDVYSLSRFHQSIIDACSLLEKYYGLTSHAYTAATVLDPRMKLSYFEKFCKLPGHESVAAVEQIVREELGTYLEVLSQTDTSGRSVLDVQSQASMAQTSALDLLLGAMGPIVKETDELDDYVRDSRIRNGENPLHYWRANAVRFPALAAAARDYLAAPGTSAPSERVFSYGRHLISEFRGSLGPKTIKHAMCLKSWMSFFRV